MGMYRGVFNVTEGNAGGNNNIQSIIDNASKSAKTAGVPAENILKAVYTTQKDIQPNKFIAKVGESTNLEIEAQDNGYGCMGSVTIPGLTDQVEILEKGVTTVLNFTPTIKGDYQITCAMGVPRGIITVE